MCGIIAVVRRPDTRKPPAVDEVVNPVAAAAASSARLGDQPSPALLDETAAYLGQADHLLRGVAGATILLAERSLGGQLRTLLDRIDQVVADLESRLDTGEIADDDGLEALNAALIRVKDASWSIRSDRIRTVEGVRDLAGSTPASAAIAGFLSTQQALAAIDRMEVRGRDSAGLQLLVSDHRLDLDSPEVAALLDGRDSDPLFTSGTVRTLSGALAFVYKAAAEIGELGDNTRKLREAIRTDPLLRWALDNDHARTLVLGHTRWASVGIVSQANAHPLDSLEVGGSVGPFVTGVLNGDIDNFADLKASEGLRIPSEITTDAKLIPTLMSRHLASGEGLVDAFRDTVTPLEGSVAVAASSGVDPDRLCLALRGSGAVYVGLADDAFIAASEPYGVIEEAETYLRMDGETPADPENPSATRGQIVVLDSERAGAVEGINRWSYDGAPVPVRSDELVTPEITTRDIDRGEHPHYLLKEVSEAPASFRTTLRGKLVTRADHTMKVTLSERSFPERIRQDLANKKIDRVLVVGQGTAAVAGQSLAAVLGDLVADLPLQVEPMLATELSGFALRPDMGDTLVIAISQSGTTTDTNRTVDLVRARGARVIAIVNRRSSDLTEKSDGVLYTSDGRDVEMSVASTKAFYAQVAAGFLLAVAIATKVGVSVDTPQQQELLRALRDLPTAMAAVLELRPTIAKTAQRVAPSRRYWALVGNGRNLIAARELRIKLSELCYKSIACDGTEDKKHIDLSSEPMILVCATGLSTSTAADVAKEVSMYRSHKAAPVVITGAGEARFDAALDVITVPAVHPQLGFILSAMAGHLFGYEAALAIDAQARPLREARGTIEDLVAQKVDSAALLSTLRGPLAPAAGRFFDGLRAGEYDGHLEPSTAVRLATMLRFALGIFPLDAYESEMGRTGSPGAVIEDLTEALTRGIEELTRPIDAIKHQAKTVTVGISRSDESLLDMPLVRSVLDAGAARDRLSYTTLKALADLDPAVVDVLGYTRYTIDGAPTEDGAGEATVTVVDKGGIARDIPSRTERDPQLRGTKHQVALERKVFVNVGRKDGRTTVLVPEVKGNHSTGITLLHVRLAERLAEPAARTVLQGYRGRYAALRDAVMETEPAFRDDLLAEVPVVDLLTSPIQPLADRWRSDDHPDR